MLRAGCFLLVVLAFAAIQIKGSCVIGKIKKAPTTDESGNNVTVKYCEYLKQNYTLGETWSYSAPTCMNCTCAEPLWSCCGYGNKAGEFQTPTGCQLADYTCDVVFVKSSNTSQPCFDLESDSSESI